MDPFTNPFSPGAGTKPPELAGRAQVLNQADVLLNRVKNKRSEKSLMLTGLRGVGKTVLLNAMREKAFHLGYESILVEAHENKSMAQLMASPLRSMLLQLSKKTAAGEAMKRCIAIFKSFVKSIKLTLGDIAVGIDIQPESGTADSGDLELDFPEVLAALGEAAADQGSFLAILIDEIQFFDSKELSALIMAMHRVQQRQLPIAMVGAGLPILPGLAGESKSYAERLFAFPNIGPLTHDDTRSALQEPVRPHRVAFSNSAIDRIYELTRGYPYFIQEWGYHSWVRAASTPIDIDVIDEATIESLERLDQDFFRVRFDRCTNAEKKFMRAIAMLGDGAQQTSAIAKELGVKMNSIGPTRASLIRKGMIYSPEHGAIEFTVPLFGEFLLRAMPNL